MVAVIRGLRRKRPQDIALRADLIAAEWVGRDGLVGVLQVIDREAVAARAVLDDGVGLDPARSIIDHLEELREFPHVLLGIIGMMGGIVVGADRVHMLAVELEPVESIIVDELAHPGFLLAEHVRVHRGEIEAVPVGDLLGLALLGDDDGLGIFLEELRAGVGGERAPPQLSLEAVLVEHVDQVLHLLVAARELAAVEVPVAFRDLEAVVQRRPLEAELSDLGERPHDLLDRESTAISPGAPGGLERLRLALGHHHADPLQQAGIPAERREAVALIRADEALERREGLARGDGAGAVKLLEHRNGSGRRTRLHLDGQADELRIRGDMADDDAGVLPPQADDGDASAVVVVVHAHVILLVETGTDRKDPVGALLGRLPLEGPEVGIVTGRSDLEAAGGPALHVDGASGIILEGSVDDEHGREIFIRGQGQGAHQLRPGGGLAHDRQAGAGAELVRDARLLGGNGVERNGSTADDGRRHFSGPVEEGRFLETG